MTEIRWLVQQQAKRVKKIVRSYLQMISAMILRRLTEGDGLRRTPIVSYNVVNCMHYHQIMESLLLITYTCLTLFLIYCLGYLYYKTWSWSCREETEKVRRAFSFNSLVMGGSCSVVVCDSVARNNLGVSPSQCDLN